MISSWQYSKRQHYLKGFQCIILLYMHILYHSFSFILYRHLKRTLRIGRDTSITDKFGRRLFVGKISKRRSFPCCFQVVLSLSICIFLTKLALPILARLFEIIWLENNCFWREPFTLANDAFRTSSVKPGLHMIVMVVKIESRYFSMDSL
jgi:hypothetical protein